MKSKIIFLLLFVGTIAAAQTTIQGIVKDAETNEAVPFASVAIKNTALGAVTNEEGQFRLNISGNGIIVISSIGYTTKEVNTETLKREGVILLKPDVIQLDELTVTNVPLYEVLDGLINASKAKFDKQAVYNTYYREIVADNDNITKFSDGLLDYITDYKGKKPKSTLFVSQNRAVQVFNEDDEEYFKNINTKINVQNGILYSRFGILHRNIVEKHENYTFSINKPKNSTSDTLSVLAIKPKEGIKKALLEGTVTYNPETKLIYEVVLYLSPSHAEFATGISLFGAHYKELDGKIVVKYSTLNGSYIPTYVYLYDKFKFWDKKTEEVIECKSDLLVTNFSKTGTEAFKDKESYNKKRLYERPSSYTDKYWQQNNAIVLTQKEEELIRKLEEGNIAVK